MQETKRQVSGVNCNSTGDGKKKKTINIIIRE